MYNIDNEQNINSKQNIKVEQQGNEQQIHPNWERAQPINMNRQLYEQQQMANNTMYHQNINNQMSTPQYMPVPMITKIRNRCSILSAILCLISAFVPFVEDYTIDDIIDVMRLYEAFDPNGTEATYRFLEYEFTFLIITGILLLISGFVKIRFVTAFFVVMHFFFWLYTLSFLFGEAEIKSEDLGIGFYLMTLSVFCALASLSKGAYVIEAVNYGTPTPYISQPLYYNMWICPRCRTQNTGIACMMCGMTRK